MGKKGGIRLLRITEIPEWKLGGRSGEAADAGHYHALHVALACWVGLGFTCFSPQSCILLTTSRTLSPLLLLSEEMRGKSLSCRGCLFSLTQMTVPFPHLCLRDGAPFLCSLSAFISPHLRLPISHPTARFHQTERLTSSHLIKFILYPPGVSLLSYMCQD